MTAVSRRSILQTAAGAVLASNVPRLFTAVAESKVATGRPGLADRRFSSAAIEEAIVRIKRQISDAALASMFEQCFPNTLDTTVFAGTVEGEPDTFVITGDIDAMWLRDSSAQVWPYLQFAREDKHLKEMLQGVVRRHAQCILIDPYANAFTKSTSDPALSWARNDFTTMLPGVAERKWEIDSLCHVLRLAHGYWQLTGDVSPFDNAWKAAAWKIVETFRQQQRIQDPGPYSFQRSARNPTDTLTMQGYGAPARSVGMIYSMFRPSDDACIYPLFVPANLFAVLALDGLSSMASGVLKDDRLANASDSLAREVHSGLQQYGSAQLVTGSRIWAYEVDGYGNALMMDDPNVPSLVSLGYLGACPLSDPMYQRTRGFALSSANPYFARGTAAEGVASPHVGLSSIWPMSLIVRAFTAQNDREIVQCLRWLRDTTARTGFIHESFEKDDPSKFTRPWFAWANTMFGELIVALAKNKPQLLRAI